MTTMTRQHTQLPPTPSLFIPSKAKLTPNVRCPQTYQQNFLICTLCKSLTSIQANLLGPYNQGIKVWNKTKYIKKRRQALHEIPTQERRNSIKGAFQIHPPPLFLVLTYKIIYQYHRSELTSGKSQTQGLNFKGKFRVFRLLKNAFIITPSLL